MKRSKEMLDRIACSRATRPAPRFKAERDALGGEAWWVRDNQGGVLLGTGRDRIAPYPSQVHADEEARRLNGEVRYADEGFIDRQRGLTGDFAEEREALGLPPKPTLFERMASAAREEQPLSQLVRTTIDVELTRAELEAILFVGDQVGWERELWLKLRDARNRLDGRKIG
jgi:hypothetical protein